MSRGASLRLVVVLLAAIAALIPLPASVVEAAFSRGLYPLVQPIVTGASNRVPIALLDLLAPVVVAGFGMAALRRLRRGRPLTGALARIALDAVTAAAVLYLAFLALWGLHYRREALDTRPVFARARVTPERVRALADEAVAALNDLADEAHRQPPPAWTIDADLARAFDAARWRLGDPWPVTPGRPKRTVFAPFFRRAAVDGFTDPFFLEILVNPDLLPVERPFVVAHEWGHLAGFAREDEASFVAWLACREAGPAARYSAWLGLWSPLVRSLPPADRDAVRGALAPQPRADLRAIAERVARADPRIQAASWQAYDRFLRANRVETGVTNYDEVVALVAAFPPD